MRNYELWIWQVEVELQTSQGWGSQASRELLLGGLAANSQMPRMFLELSTKAYCILCVAAMPAAAWTHVNCQTVRRNVELRHTITASALPFSPSRYLVARSMLPKRRAWLRSKGGLGFGQLICSRDGTWEGQGGGKEANGRSLQ